MSLRMEDSNSRVSDVFMNISVNIIRQYEYLRGLRTGLLTFFYLLLARSPNVVNHKIRDSIEISPYPCHIYRETSYALP